MFIFRIVRSGKFVVDSHQAQPSQCGFEGCRTYTYEVLVEARGDKLNQEGFVMDREDVDRYFYTTYNVQKKNCLSCENMAEQALNYFIVRFKTEPSLQMVKPLRIVVRISGDENGYIEAERMLNENL